MGRKRPPRSARALEAAVDRYFQSCDQEKRAPTVTGLSLALGFDSREELERFARETGDGQAGLLAWARSRVEEETLQAAFRRETATGARFLLQAEFGYGGKAVPELGPITVQVEEEGMG